MFPTQRIALSVLLAAIATLVSATAAAARPAPVVPDATVVTTSTGSPVLDVVTIHASPLWQFALVALIAAALAAAITNALRGRSVPRGRSGLAPTAG